MFSESAAKKETVPNDFPVYSERTLALSTALSAISALLIGFLLGFLASRRCAKNKSCWGKELPENEK
jgi:hypothetical protein